MRALQQKHDRACRDNGGTSGSVLKSYIAKLSLGVLALLFKNMYII